MREISLGKTRFLAPLEMTSESPDNNSTWAGDQMWPDSSYINPISPHSDREKPEVVAVGASITVFGLDNDNPDTVPGTSVSTPQVTGLGALLVDRNSALHGWPESMRAIILASAFHNIDGPVDIPPGQDSKDGVGAVVAIKADEMARTRAPSFDSTCSGPCWAGIPITNTTFPVGTDKYLYFTATQGKRVRVAIVWLSQVDCSSGSTPLNRGANTSV